MHSFNTILRYLELGDFGDSYLIGRGKCARFCELQLKMYEMKSQPVSLLKTQMQCGSFTQKWENFLKWIGYIILRFIMPKILEKTL